MNKKEYSTAVNNMVYLIYCILHNTIPDKSKVEDMNLEYLYKAAQDHMLTAITAMALESAGVKNHEFTQAKGKAFRKNAALDIERTKLCSYLDSKGIWYLPLKGAVLKDYYPAYGMRQMSDNDILFDPNYREEIKEYFLSCGYEVEQYNVKYHDVYIKPPVSNFEMHVLLFGKDQASFYGYYKKIKERLIKDGEGCGYKFCNEDFYIYMNAHEHKHFDYGGTGLRSVLDTYIFLNKFKDTLDSDYIQKEIDKLHLTAFEHDIRELAFNLFDKNELDEKNREMYDYIVSSGSYGNFDNVVGRKMKEMGVSGTLGKIRYVWKRIFPPLSRMQECYPEYFEHKILLPLLPFHRLKRMLTLSRHNVKGEITALSKRKG